MKKILILFIIISSCKKEVYYYPSKSFFEEYSPKEIVIDNLNFEEITDSIRNGLFRKENHFIELEDTYYKYRISPFADTGGFIKERNGLYIRNDSLDLIKGIFPMNDLSKYLKLHYENNDKEYFYASSYKWAYIKLIFEKKENSNKLKTNLLRLVQVYNKTNIKNKDSIDFHIMLEYPLEKSLNISPLPIPLEIED